MEPVYNERMQRKYASDRRAHTRRRLPVAELELSDSLGGSVLDISEAGMAVQGVSRLTPQNFSRVRFRLPDSASWIETSCKIAWMSDAQDVAGVEFEDLGDLERAQIRGWSERLGKPEPWVKDPGTPRRTVTMELPLSLAPVPEEPMFRSESWVREPSGVSYGKGILLVAVIVLAAAALLFAVRSGWATRLFESSRTTPASPASTATDARDSQGAVPSPTQDAEPAALSNNAASSAVAPNASASKTGQRPANAPVVSSPAAVQEFIVQVGAMRIRGNADALAARLQGDKFPTIQFQGRENLNVVAVGPFSDERTAQSMRDALRAKGFDGMIRRLPAQ